MINFFVNRNWKKLSDSRKRAKILAHNRKSHNPQMPHPRDWQGGQMPPSSPGGGRLGAGGIDWCITLQWIFAGKMFEEISIYWQLVFAADGWKNRKNYNPQKFRATR